MTMTGIAMMTTISSQPGDASHAYAARVRRDTPATPVLRVWRGVWRKGELAGTAALNLPTRSFGTGPFGHPWIRRLAAYHKPAWNAIRGMGLQVRRIERTISLVPCKKVDPKKEREREREMGRQRDGDGDVEGGRGPRPGVRDRHAEVALGDRLTGKVSFGSNSAGRSSHVPTRPSTNPAIAKTLSLTDRTSRCHEPHKDSPTDPA